MPPMPTKKRPTAKKLPKPAKKKPTAHRSPVQDVSQRAWSMVQEIARRSEFGKNSSRES